MASIIPEMTGIFTVTLTVQGIYLRGNTPNHLAPLFATHACQMIWSVPDSSADKCSLRSMNKRGVSSLDHRDKVMTEKR